MSTLRYIDYNTVLQLICVSRYTTLIPYRLRRSSRIQPSNSLAIKTVSWSHSLTLPSYIVLNSFVTPTAGFRHRPIHKLIHKFSTMPLLTLPTELLWPIIVCAVLERSLRRALRLRLVNSAYFQQAHISRVAETDTIR